MARLLVLAVVAISFELSSWAALWLIGKTVGLRYQDVSVPTRDLTEEHREILRRMIEGHAIYYDLSAELGWTIKPGGRNNGYRANSQGLRSDFEHSEQPLPDTVRIAAFGDSFTHGDGVGNEDAWGQKLDALRPDWEVLNFGVGGFGPDQALLRYRYEGARRSPHVVLIGFMPENINRVVSVFRPFYGPGTGIPMSKPRFLLGQGALQLVPNPLPTRADYARLLETPGRFLSALGEHDHHFQVKCKQAWIDRYAPVRLIRLVGYALRSRFSGNRIIDPDGTFNQGSEAFRLSVAILTQFSREALEQGSLPVVLFFPSQYDVARSRSGLSARHAALMAAVCDSGVLCLDLADAFATRAPERSLAELFHGHYSPLGNEIVADYVGDWLQEQGLTNVEAVRRRVRAATIDAAGSEHALGAVGGSLASRRARAARPGRRISRPGLDGRPDPLRLRVAQSSTQ